MALLDRVMSFGDRKEGFFAKQRHGSDPNKGIEARENFDNHEGPHFLKEMPFSRSGFCLIRQAKAWNDDFDRGKSEQLKTKRIGRSRNITSPCSALGTVRTPHCQAGTRDGVQKASTNESQKSELCDCAEFCPDHGGMLGFAWGPRQQD